MAVVIIFFVVLLICGIAWIPYSSYEDKVVEVKDCFFSKISKYKELLNLKFEVRTDGKKIKTWDTQHKIDYIINKNKDEIIRTLKLYNNFKIWWVKNRDRILNETQIESNRIADNMFLFKNSFRKRADGELEDLIAQLNPDLICYKLKTYSIQSSTEHYNAKTHQWYEDSSPIKTSFYRELTPEEVLFRIEVLSKYNFEMTEYQYNCENQRSLMTPELRKEIILRDSSTCQMCGKKCQDYEIEIDHIQPISKGGKTTKSNLQVLCVSCNRSKSNKWLNKISSNLNQQVNVKETNIDKAWENFNKEYNRESIKARVGDVVDIEYLSTNEKISFKLVDEVFDSFQDCISIYSPLGKAICGLNEGEVVDFETANGKVSIKIVRINRK